MGNTKTPTGDSTGKLTKEQAEEKKKTTVPCTVLGKNADEIELITVADVMVAYIADPNKVMTKKEDKTPDTVNPIAAGRKDEGAHSIDIEGKKYTGKPQELNESLKRAEKAEATRESAAAKQQQNNTQQDR